MNPFRMLAAAVAILAAAPLFAQTCNPLPFVRGPIASTTKQAFAFYFPPFPVSIENAAPANDYYSRWIYSLNSAGGAYDLRDRPLPRAPLSGAWKQKDFETEVRRAIAMGLDGFIWEYHESGDLRWMQLPAMLAAVRAVDPSFRIMLSPDFPLEAGASSDAVAAFLLAVKDEPLLYRTADGRVVLAPFYPERQPVAWWDELRVKLAQGGMSTALVPIFLSWSGAASEKREWIGHVDGWSTWGTRTASGVVTYTRNAREAHARGGLWMQPAAFEDTRAYDGRYWESSNSSLLRASLETAIAANTDRLFAGDFERWAADAADLVALITWNDYTESWVSPSRERGYAVGDVAAYWIEWFKRGRAPTITQDALYWFHRSHRTDAPFSQLPTGRNGQPVTMYVPNGDAARNEVELVAFLTAPGTLTIRQGADVRTREAPAGVTSFKAALVPGTTPEFSLVRGASVVASHTSTTPVRAQVPFQDMLYHAGGGVACARD